MLVIDILRTSYMISPFWCS